MTQPATVPSIPAFSDVLAADATTESLREIWSELRRAVPSLGQEYLTEVVGGEEDRHAVVGARPRAKDELRWLAWDVERAVLATLLPSPEREDMIHLLRAHPTAVADERWCLAHDRYLLGEHLRRLQAQTGLLDGATFPRALEPYVRAIVAAIAVVLDSESGEARFQALLEEHFPILCRVEPLNTDLRRFIPR